MKKLLVAAAALAVSTGAMAGPSWTYVDAGYVTGDAGDESTDGFGLRGSFGFADIWHIQADYLYYEQAGGKDKSGGNDVNGYSIRGGVHPAVTDNTDFVADIAYTGGEIDNGSTKTEPDSIDLRTGVRSNVGNLELRSFVTLSYGSEDLPGGNDDFTSVSYQVGGQYNFSDAWSVGADVSLNDSIISGDLLDLYVRWSF
jgi:hypothetical protein